MEPRLSGGQRTDPSGSDADARRAGAGGSEVAKLAQLDVGVNGQDASDVVLMLRRQTGADRHEMRLLVKVRVEIFLDPRDCAPSTFTASVKARQLRRTVPAGARHRTGPGRA